MQMYGRGDLGRTPPGPNLPMLKLKLQNVHEYLVHLLMKDFNTIYSALRSYKILTFVSKMMPNNAEHCESVLQDQPMSTKRKCDITSLSGTFFRDAISQGKILDECKRHSTSWGLKWGFRGMPSCPSPPPKIQNLISNLICTIHSMVMILRSKKRHFRLQAKTGKITFPLFGGSLNLTNLKIS